MEEQKEVIEKDQERFYYKRVFYNLEDLRNQGKEWRKEYNNFPMRPLGWLSPRKFIEKYKSTRRIVICNIGVQSIYFK